MDKNQLAGFILDWRWQLKKARVKKKKWRIDIADKFRKSPQKMNGEWTIEDFCKVYDDLVKQGAIK